MKSAGKVLLAILVVVLTMFKVLRLGKIFSKKDRHRDYTEYREYPTIQVTSFSDTSEKIYKATGWQYIDGQKKWVIQPNLIAETKNAGKNSPEAIHFHWMQSAMFTQGNLYYMLMIETNYPGIPMQYYRDNDSTREYFATRYMAFNWTEYDLLKEVVNGKTESAEVFADYVGTIANTYEFETVDITHSKLLNHISANMTARQNPDMDMYSQGQAKQVGFSIERIKQKGKEFIKFTLPGKDIARQYFTVPIGEFKKLLIG